MKLLCLISLIGSAHLTNAQDIAHTLNGFEGPARQLGIAAANGATDDDCGPIPPGCEIYNPWTCECEVGLKDPWETDPESSPDPAPDPTSAGIRTALAKTKNLSAMMKFERAILEGRVRPVKAAEVSEARREVPGTDFAAYKKRLRLYLTKKR